MNRRILVYFLLGLALSVLLVARSQVGGDQLNLLARGWFLMAEGKWISYGNPMSSGGAAPGGITSLLVGLPLLGWQHHRAPNVLILLTHIAAWLLLDQTLKKVLSPRERVFLAVFYWLNPWRAYLSGFLWNPNYLFLFGSLHLWTTFGQRHRARFVLSFLHGLGLVLTFQIHASFLLLVMASALLWWRGYWKVQWPGLIAGAVLAGLPLIPWYLEASRNPAITNVEHGFLGRGLVYVFPLLRGTLYWFRYASLAVPDKMGRIDFPDWSHGDELGAVCTAIVRFVLPLTLIAPLLANRWLWRRAQRWWRQRFPEDGSDRRWLLGYVAGCFAAALLVFALAPTTIMWWQVVLLFHAAVLPLVLWTGALARTRWKARVERGVTAWAVASALVILVLALGGTHYRCGGRAPLQLALRYDHPMLHDLHILDSCSMPVDNDPQGWWPDVLPVPNTGPGS
jgi:hypothetical protein